MNDLNLCKILRQAPEGTKLYSPIFGEVRLLKVEGLRVRVEASDGHKTCFASRGEFYNNYDDAECLLFPSKEQRDWSKFRTEPDLPEGTLVACWDEEGVNIDDVYISLYARDGEAMSDLWGTSEWAYIVPVGRLSGNKYPIVDFTGVNYGTEGGAR